MQLLEVEGLRKRFSQTTAVDGLSFAIDEGRCVALLGPNGAGKTTTLNMLSGLMKPSEGTIRFSSWSGSDGDIRSFIGYLPQIPSFYKWMTGREYMAYVGKLAGMNAKTAKERTSELLTLVGLEDAGKRRIGGYSGGMKQRLGIAQALIHRPRLLMLDEPVSALDPIGRREILELIRELKQTTTILFSTHVLHDAEEVSDDVLIMQSGRIAVSGSLTEVRQAYQEPIIRVQAEAPLSEWAAGLTGRLGDLIVQTEISGLTAVITVRRMEEAKLAVMADLVQQRVSVTRFEAAKTTLEDLFMKVVGA